MSEQWSGWVLAGETSVVFYGGFHEYELRDDYGLIQAGDNFLQIAVMSDSRHIGVTVDLAEELPALDTSEKWESIAETSVAFEAPPGFGRPPDESFEGDTDPIFATMNIPAGTYRVRCSASGVTAAEERRLHGNESEPTPGNSAELREQIRISFAPAATIEPRVVLRRSRPDYPL